VAVSNFDVHAFWRQVGLLQKNGLKAAWMPHRNPLSPVRRVVWRSTDQALMRSRHVRGVGRAFIIASPIALFVLGLWW
jgi:hypothetical protein